MTWTQIMTLSLHPVRPMRSASPQTLRSSLVTRSSSLCSSCRPPSTCLYWRGVHFCSRHLARNSGLCFLNVATAKRTNSSSLATSVAERGTTIGANVSYSLRKSFFAFPGTTIRWVSIYSESWTRRDGSTIGVKDLVERLPLYY